MTLGLATVVKMNEDELPLILHQLGLSVEAEPESAQREAHHQRAGAARLLREFPSLALVAITRGSHGSLLVNREDWNNHPGFPVSLADPIGAGDAFTAAMTHSLLSGAGLAAINEAGNRCGGWVASQPGAMSPLPEAARDAIAAAIERTS